MENRNKYRNVCSHKYGVAWYYPEIVGDEYEQKWTKQDPKFHPEVLTTYHHPGGASRVDLCWRR